MASLSLSFPIWKVGCQCLCCWVMESRTGSGRPGTVCVPLFRKRPDQSWVPATLPGLGSHLAGLTVAWPGHPLEIPHPLLCEWKGNQNAKRDLCLLSGQPSPVWGASSPRAGGAASASFLGPHTPFSCVPQSRGGGHCAPQAWTSASGTSGDGAHGGTLGPPHCGWCLDPPITG